jgi:hypothetical protein
MTSSSPIKPIVRRSANTWILAFGALLLCGHGAKADNLANFNSSPDIPGGMTLQATGSETGTYETNPLLLLNGAKTLWGSITSPELTFNSKTPTSLLSVDTLLNENLFNISSFDSTDVHQKVNLTDQMQQWGAGFLGQVDYDTTRTNNLFPTGINNVSVTKSVRHLGLDFSPQVTYNSNTTNKFSLAGSVQDSQYDDPIFANYAIASLTPSYAHSFDPQNTGTVSLQAQRYESTSGPKAVDDTVGPSFGWISTLTPRLTAKLSAGFQEARQFGSGTTQEPWTTQYVFSGDIAFKGQQDQTDLSMTRNDYPFGNGTESLLTTLALSETHALNQNFSLTAGASYQTADYQASTPGDLQNLISGNGGVVYHATDLLDITAAYQFRYETLTNTSGSAQDHMVTFGLTYRPHAWTL